MFFTEVVILRVLGDADDAEPASPAVDADADGIAIGKETAHKGLIDDHHGGGFVVFVVALGEVAAFKNGDVHEGQIAGRDDVAEDAHVLIGARRVAFDLELFPPAWLEAKGNAVRVGDVGDSGADIMRSSRRRQNSLRWASV